MTLSSLSAPLTLPCGAVLPNRIAKAAMSEGLADANGHPTPRLESALSTLGRLRRRPVAVRQHPGRSMAPGATAETWWSATTAASKHLSRIAAAGTSGGAHFWGADQPHRAPGRRQDQRRAARAVQHRHPDHPRRGLRVRDAKGDDRCRDRDGDRSIRLRGGAGEGRRIHRRPVARGARLPDLAVPEPALQPARRPMGRLTGEPGAVPDRGAGRRPRGGWSGISRSPSS